MPESTISQTAGLEKTGFLKAISESVSADSFQEFLPVLGAKGKRVLEMLNFPNSRTEDWKYSRTAKISGGNFGFKAAKAFDISEIPGLFAHQIRISNGHFSAEHSKIKSENPGVILCDLKTASERYPELVEQYIGSIHKTEKDIFSAMNASWAQNGIFLYVPKNTKVDSPIEILIELNADQALVQPRNLIILEKSASAEIILRAKIKSNTQNLINGVSEIFVADNAELKFTHFEFENRNCFQIWTHEVQQSRDSRSYFNTLSSDSDWVRNNLNITIIGPNAEANLNGAYQLDGKEHVDNHTCVDHIAPDCQSNELYKGMVDGKSNGVFNGKVFVRPDAQHTNAYQSNSNLVLSDDASMNSKPELEIYADDVKCSHGSTTGQFDEDALFYLRTRGIEENDAMKLLVKAFVGEVIEKLDNAALREYAYEKMGLSEIAGNIIL